MENQAYIPFLDAVIMTLKQTGKSEHIAALLMNVKVEEPSLIHDFLVELSLAAEPTEEDSLGCYSLDYLENAFNEFKETGKTNLLEQPK